MNREPRQSYESEIFITMEEGYQGTTKHISLKMVMKINICLLKSLREYCREKIKIKGEKAGINGDVYLKVNFKEEENNRLEGLDIYMKKDIYPWDAIFGTKLVVEAIAGRIRVNIPENIEGGKKIRIPGKGYRDMDGNRGDLYIIVNIVNPPNLTEEQKKLYQQLKESMN